MIPNFKYLKYSKEENTFHIVNTMLFNQREIDKINSITIVDDLESGDVIYKGSQFQTLKINSSNFNKYCKNILIKSKRLINGTTKSSDATLFPIDNTSGLVEFIEYVEKESDLSSADLLFNKISCDEECWSNERTISIDHIDYPVSLLGGLLDTDSEFIYTLGAVPDNCDDVSGLLRGIPIDYTGSVDSYELQVVLQSKYAPRLMNKNLLYSNIRDKKRSVDYNSYSFLMSLKNSNENLFANLLNEYDDTIITEQSHIFPASYVYYCLLSVKPSSSDRLFIGQYSLRINNYFKKSLKCLLNSIDGISVLEEFEKYMNNNLIGDESNDDLDIKLTINKRIQLSIKSTYQVDYYSIPESEFLTYPDF